MKIQIKNSFNDDELVNSCFSSNKYFGNESIFLETLGFFRSKYASAKAKYYSENYIKSKFPEVWKAQVSAREDGGLVGEYQWMRLKEIAELHNKFNFENILELGTGASTKMFSQLVEENGKVVSLEESSFWLDRTKMLVGNKNNVRFICSKRIVELLDGEIVVRYNTPKDFYNQSFDVVYIDGPTTKLTDQELKNFDGFVPDKKNYTVASVDIEYFLRNGKLPKIIIVDGKRPSVRWIYNRWKTNYLLFLRSMYSPYSSRPSSIRYHSYFIRKDLL